MSSLVILLVDRINPCIANELCFLIIEKYTGNLLVPSAPRWNARRTLYAPWQGQMHKKERMGFVVEHESALSLTTDTLVSYYKLLAFTEDQIRNCYAMERIYPKKGCAWGCSTPPHTPFFREYSH